MPSTSNPLWPGHDKVEKNQIRPFLAKQRDALRTVAGLKKLVRHVGEELPDEVSGCLVMIAHKDGRGGLRRVIRSRVASSHSFSIGFSAYSSAPSP